ncbi:hypothetical protein IV203_008506 [Nitzschia inconspicua]|uniref:Uncharacterized protein n=1 Tax=Nitzschia inconspicua TaxID=303405 RepID=A0A9K3L095_9STRA|nr:hypothetical protein IV203_008506 [Nitzschia inconspicua]
MKDGNENQEMNRRSSNEVRGVTQVESILFSIFAASATTDLGNVEQSHNTLQQWRPLVLSVGCITESVPWGYVCGYPTNGGDLYGGAHYLRSASASLTLQGKAIQEAAVDFGDGKTLPFTPCKKGYQPFIKGKRMVACLLHNAHREKRLQKEQGRIREGEADPASLFWSQLTDGGKEITKEK